MAPVSLSSPHDLARHYAAHDPNPATRARCQADIDAGTVDSDSMTPRIAFGTAGLRALMRPGYANINDLTVLQTTRGLIDHLNNCSISNTATSATTNNLSVVIGFDHRAAPEFNLSSRKLAYLAAHELLSAGFRVHLFDVFVATPLVPFAVRRLHASCGIMFTASHNPKEYNGMKIYAANGCLIISPTDTHVSNAILKHLDDDFSAVPAASDAALCAAVTSHPLRSDPTETMVKAYMESITAVANTYCAPDADANVPIMYTAMHGVAAPYVMQAFRAAGLEAPAVVVSQCSPDPSFPTVWFPNPEEGERVLRRAMDAADAAGATLLLASDPDGDRLAIAEKCNAADAASGPTWRVLSGNEIGLLLADFMHAGALRAPAAKGKRLKALNTVVSSGMLAAWGRTAAPAPVEVEATLTGFKNLGNRAFAVNGPAESDEYAYFAYEEAIGFMVDPINTGDKDGISAAVVAALMARALHARGASLVARLRELWMTRIGYFKQNNGYVATDTARGGALATRERVFARLAAAMPAPAALRAASGLSIPVTRANQVASDMFTYELDVSGAKAGPEVRLGTCSVTLRSSGTEPKIKYYCELQVFWTAAQPLADQNEQLRIMDAAATSALDSVVGAIRADWYNLEV